MNVAQNSKSPITRASTFEVGTDTTTRGLVEAPKMNNLKEQYLRIHSERKRAVLKPNDEYDDTYPGAICTQYESCLRQSKYALLLRVVLVMATPIFIAIEKVAK